MTLGIKKFFGWAYPIIIGIAIAFAIKTWVADAAEVPSASMEPTIPDPCYILVNKISTEVSGVYRGEVVVFHFPDDPSKLFVKRVVGMPGDVVQVTNDTVYVNGKPFNVSGIVLPNKGGLGTYRVPAGHYFMMGDNRPISDDSRFWNNKYVPRSAIIGQAVDVFFPFTKVKGIAQ